MRCWHPSLSHCSHFCDWRGSLALSGHTVNGASRLVTLSQELSSERNARVDVPSAPAWLTVWLSGGGFGGEDRR